MLSGFRALCSATIICAAANAPGFASPVFMDDFESGLGQWTGKSGGAHNGVIVPDPLRPGNNCLTFTDLNTDGDIFATPDGLTLIPGQLYTLSLEYLGQASPESSPDDFGGYAGLADDLIPTNVHWIYATADLDADIPLVDDDEWHGYSFDFIWDPSFVSGVDDVVQIVLMDSLFSGGRPADAFFDNILLTPEPAGATLGILMLGVVAISRRR